MGSGNLFARLFSRGEKGSSASTASSSAPARRRHRRRSNSDMSARSNASAAPPTEGGDAPPPPQAIAMKDIYSEEYTDNLKGRATYWKKTLTEKLKSDILETENARHQKFIERSGMRARWEERIEETQNFESLDIGTLQDIVALHSDFAQLNKDVKQLEVFDKKMALRTNKTEMKKNMDELSEASQRLAEILPEAAELTKKTSELREKIGSLHEVIENLDKELYEAREQRKDEDRYLVKKLKEYISEMRLPELPASSAEAVPEDEVSVERSAPPETASEADSEMTRQSEQRIQEKPSSKKASKRKATVEDANGALR